MVDREIIKDPLAQAGAAIGGIFAAFNPEVLVALLDALFASTPQLFTGVTVSALTLPQVFPPDTTTDWVVVAAGVLMLAYLGRQILQNIDREV